MTDTKFRGRPRAFDVDRAVEAAMRLFHERGYDGVGIAALAEAIGVNPPSLYAAFGSKLGLFERALARYVAGDGGVIRAAIDAGGSPEAMARRFFRNAAELYAADGGCRGCLVMDGTRNCSDPEARAVTDDLRRETRRHLIGWLAGHGLGDAERRADYLLVGLAGLSAAARDGMGRDALLDAAAMLADGFAPHRDRDSVS